MNTPQKPSARSSVPQSPAPRASDAPARRRAGNVGTNTLITVASLLATAGGWAWISHTEKLADAAADSFIVAAPAQPAADTRPVTAPLVLESIPTLVPQLQVQLPAEQRVAVQRPARAAARAARVVQTDVQPALRQVDPAAVAAIVPTAAPQVQVALQPQAAAAQPVQVAPAPQAAIAQPVQVAPAPQAPAPVTRTRSSRRRTR